MTKTPNRSSRMDVKIFWSKLDLFWVQIWDMVLKRSSEWGAKGEMTSMDSMWLFLSTFFRPCYCTQRGSRSLGFLARLWLERRSGQAKSHARPKFWLGFGLGTKAKKPWLFGLRPKPEHHYSHQTSKVADSRFAWSISGIVYTSQHNDSDWTTQSMVLI